MYSALHPTSSPISSRRNRASPPPKLEEPTSSTFKLPSTLLLLFLAHPNAPHLFVLCCALSASSSFKILKMSSSQPSCTLQTITLFCRFFKSLIPLPPSSRAVSEMIFPQSPAQLVFTFEAVSATRFFQILSLSISSRNKTKLTPPHQLSPSLCFQSPPSLLAVMHRQSRPIDHSESIRSSLHGFFKDPVGTYTAAGGDHPLEVSSRLVLTDAPYLCRRQRRDLSATRDCLTAKGMENVVAIIAQILRAGGHPTVSCSVHQCPHWIGLFHCYQTPKSRSLSLTFSSSHCSDSFVHHIFFPNGFPGWKSCARQNVAEIAVHVKENGLSFPEEKPVARYRELHFVPYCFPAYSKAIHNVCGPTGT